MVRIVNRHNAPWPLIRYASQEHYDAGDSDFTATSLDDEPRIRILTARHGDTAEDDPYENPWKYLSTVFHALLSEHGSGDDGEIAEERVFTEFNGMKISGAMDLQRVAVAPDGTKSVIIGDYKLCSVFSLKDMSKWVNQLNVYAWLIEREKPDHKVIGLEVYAFLRDWSMSTSERRGDYPRTPGQTIEIPLWHYDDREQYVAHRIAAHLEAEDELPLCSEEGRWPYGKNWRVWSGDTVHGVYELKRDAVSASESLENSLVEAVVGKYRRCQNFCPVSAFCDQNAEHLRGREAGYRGEIPSP